MPLFGKRVNEDGVVGEIVVEVHNIGNVGGGFSTTAGREELKALVLGVSRLSR